MLLYVFPSACLSGWVKIANGEFNHRTNLAELDFLVSNCDIALSPEDVVTLAATTLERLWEPLGAAIGHDELFNGQLRINGSGLEPHLDWRTSLARLLWKLGLFILHCRIMAGRSTGATVTIVISEWACTISLPIGPGGEAMLVQCVHSALCCPTDAREALQALEGAALSSPLPAVRVRTARGARVAAQYGGDASMPWALPGVPPSDGVPGIAAGELNVTLGFDSNQGVRETALDISSRFASA